MLNQRFPNAFIVHINPMNLFQSPNRIINFLVTQDRVRILVAGQGNVDQIVQDVALQILFHFSINFLGFTQLTFQVVNRGSLDTHDGIQFFFLKLETEVWNEQQNKVLVLDLFES